MTEEKSDADLLNEYVDADRRHDELIDRYFPVTTVAPGKKARVGEPTAEAFEELDRLGREAEEARQRWMASLQRSDRT